MTKKLIAISMSVLFLLFGFSGCSSNDSSVNSSKYKVAMITSAGGLGDRSFNDSGQEGLKRAKEKLGVDYKIVLLHHKLLKG